MEIQLGNSSRVVLVDIENYEELNQWKWFLRNGYATRRKNIDGKTREIFMHRIVANTPDGLETDHKNGDRLDNRKENLRFATRKQNAQNMRPPLKCRNRYKGVRKYTPGDSGVAWVAKIKVDKVVIALGSYTREEDAAWAYNQAATKHFGEFAWLNEIPSWADGSSKLEFASEYTGVHRRREGVWEVVICLEEGNKKLGLYRSEEEAASVYDAAALKYGKHQSRLNNILYEGVSTRLTRRNSQNGARSKSGYQGVKKMKNRWATRIVHNKCVLHIGMYKTIEEAVEAHSLARAISDQQELIMM